MEKFLTKAELEIFLYKIRNTLCTYDYESLNNVIFFNNEAVFRFLCEIPLIGDEEQSVGDALDAIEAYIPVSLTENSLKFLMQSASAPEMMHVLEADFSKKNKMDFLQIITQVSSGTEWNRVLNLCETIRCFRLKEETAVLV